MNAGLLYALGAFIIWGLFPLYLLQVASVSPLELTLHRSTWALVFLVAVLSVLGRWRWLPELRHHPRRLVRFLGTATLLTVNWLLYIYAVQTGRVVEASLGYFINPLVNVLLGVVVLHERLRPAQWVAVALAACGVAWLTALTGSLPWIALLLACSFGVYGLLRKTAALGALEGLTMETLLLAPITLPWLAVWTLSHGGAMARGDLGLDFWLLLGGPLTALPLMLFAMAARRLPLATLGLVQYVSPTLQLLLGLWVFHEPFGAARAVGFVLIWSALALYSADALRRRSLP